MRDPPNTQPPKRAPEKTEPPHMEPPKPRPAAPTTPAPKPPGSADEHERRGRELTQSRQYKEAIAELAEAIRLKPDLARAYNARGYAYLLLHDYAHALSDF